VISVVLRRLVASVVVLFVVSIVVFGLLHLAPGDPATVLAGADASPENVDAIRAELGLDRPPVQQYVEWVSGMVTGDLGMSYTVQRPVSELIGQRIGSTLQLTVAATVILVVLGVAMGAVMATSRSRLVRNVLDQVSTLCLALPPFVSGVILIFLFAVIWQVLPSGGDAPFLEQPGESLQRLLLPSVAMALPSAPVVARLLATEMRRASDQEYVLTALAKGASPRWVTWRHVVPNSLGPPIIEVGIRVGHMLGGAIVAEAIFARSGLGSLLIRAVTSRDYRLAQVLLMLTVAAAILAQLIAELLMARLDPRVRLGARR